MPKMAREKDPEKNELSKEHTGKCMRYGEWMQSMKSRNLWNQNQAIKIEEKKEEGRWYGREMITVFTETQKGK